MKRFCLLPLLLWLTTTSAWALPEDRDQPIRLQADFAEFDQNTGISIYRGNVQLTQGSMALNADEARIFLQGGEFTRMEATGAPATFRYQPELDKAPINGVGQRVEYDVATSTVVVTGNVEFEQDGDVFSGERVVYDLRTDLVTAGSQNGGGRVTITLQPRNND